MRIQYQYDRSHWEALFWLIALVALALFNPSEGGHFSLCLFKYLGVEFCPGCGLGHSIAFLFRGQFLASFHAHPLGGVAVVVLFRRSVLLLKNQISIN